MEFHPKKVRESVLDFLKSKDFPTNEKLPLIEKFVFKSSTEVAVQIIILYALTGLAHDADSQALKDWLVENRIYSDLSDLEKIFIDRETLSSREIVDLSWKQESLFALSWCGLLVKEIGLPHSECSLKGVFLQIPPEVEASDFIKKLRLRSSEQIAFQADLHYCLHWILRHPESWGVMEGPNRLNLDIVIERRRAFEWITRSSVTWENIALDT